MLEKCKTTTGYYKQTKSCIVKNKSTISFLKLLHAKDINQSLEYMYLRVYITINITMIT